MLTDCLIIGYSHGRLEDEVRMLRSMRSDHPDSRGLSLKLGEIRLKHHSHSDVGEAREKTNRLSLGEIR